MNVEIYYEDGKFKVFISEENSTGVEYSVTSINEIGEVIQEHIAEYGIKVSE